MKILMLTIFILIIYGCEQIINLDLPEKDSRLVVSGLITNENTVYYVKITKTSKYTFKYNLNNEDNVKGALVIVNDNIGNIDTLDEVKPGNYRTHIDKIKGTIGRSYKVSIITDDGKRFESDMEKMPDVPMIDSIYFQRDISKKSPDNPDYYLYDIYIDWHEPADQTNYYLRSMSYYWGGEWHDNVQWNWVFNDKYINGNFLQKDNVNESYGGKNWIFKLNQYSLTKSAYDFWNLVYEQTQSDGDNANSAVPLIGNIYNTENPNDYALGYFQVSALTTIQVNINR
jgi:hypothetical protein